MTRKSNPNTVWLYSVYRNSDDMLIVFDVTADEAAKSMGMSRSSLYHLWSVLGGKNGTWTVTRKSVKEIEEEINA